MRISIQTKILIASLLVLSSIIIVPRIVTALTTQEHNDREVCLKQSTIQHYAKCRVSDHWDDTQWESFNYIIQKESGWCSTAWNGEIGCPDLPRDSKIPGKSSAFGLCQTMMSLHEVEVDFKTNEMAQVDWCINYAKLRYGTPIDAKNFWVNNKHW